MGSTGDWAGTQLDLFLLRHNPSLLDDKLIMHYFIMLNNCGAPRTDIVRLRRSFDSELDYPPIAKFYKARASPIVKDIPTGLTLHMDTFPDPRDKGLIPTPLELGEYDTTRKAFPFVFRVGGNKTKMTLAFDDTKPFPARGNITGVNSCMAATQSYGGVSGLGRSIYIVAFKAVKIAELPMDESAAGTWIRKYAGARRITLDLDLDLLQQPPESVSVRNPLGGSQGWKFAAELKKITVLDARKEIVGVLDPQSTR
jgi:hypothetical protein